MRDRGQVLLEYLLLLGLVAVLALASFKPGGIISQTGTSANTYFKTGQRAILGGYVDASGKQVMEDPAPIHGGWCDFSSCINGVKVRECACPRPAFGGTECVGDAVIPADCSGGGNGGGCTPSCAGKCSGSDGCTGTCPNNCSYPQTCGGGGVPNVCGGGCTPNCAGKCGGGNGCSGTCPDNCSFPQSCGGGGVPNVCGCITSCAGKCGGSDGCTGTCPDNCVAPQTCGGSGTANVCGQCVSTGCAAAATITGGLSYFDNCGTYCGLGQDCVGACGVCPDGTPCNFISDYKDAGGYDNQFTTCQCGAGLSCSGLTKPIDLSASIAGTWACYSYAGMDHARCGASWVKCFPSCVGKCGGGSDGCMGTCFNACTLPQTCGGGGTPKVCGCTPVCAGKCGGSDSCGSTCPNNCVSPQTCGGGGVSNVCGCTANCAGKCGGSNGCSGTCPNNCAAPKTCGGGGTPNVCGP